MTETKRAERSSLKQWPKKPDGTHGSSEPKRKETSAPVVEETSAETGTDGDSAAGE